MNNSEYDPTTGLPVKEPGFEKQSSSPSKTETEQQSPLPSEPSQDAHDPALHSIPDSLISADSDFDPSESMPAVESGVPMDQHPAPQRENRLRGNTSFIPNSPAGNATVKTENEQKIISITGHLQAKVQTESAIARDLNPEIYASLHSGKILTGNLTGRECTSDRTHYYGIVWFGDYKVLIPDTQMFVLSTEERSTVSTPEQAYRFYGSRIYHRMGMEMNFRVTEVDRENKIAVASRREAMRTIAKDAYSWTYKDSDSEYVIDKGSLIESRIVCITQNSIIVEAYGIESQIHMRDLNMSQYTIDELFDKYRVGENLVVKVVNIDRTKPHHNYPNIVLSEIAVIRPNFERFISRISPDTMLSGKVLWRTERYIFVQIAPGLNVMCRPPKTYNATRFRRGSPVNLYITNVDRKNEALLGWIAEDNIRKRIGR